MKEIEALNVVRQMVADGQVSQEVAEKYFPELAESEDERMKKAIYYVIANTPYGLISNTGFTIFQMKNWLEKQGEQKVIIPKFRVGDVIRYDEDGEINRVIEIVEEGYKLEHGTHILCFNSQDYWELVEQKPWSEEDEKLINSVIELIDDGALDRDEKDYFIEKLKSLKDRVQPQQEWSEEDNRILHAIRNALNYEKPRNYLKSRDLEFLEVLDWLKSLKDRIQPKQEWSEEDETYSDHIITAIKSYYTDDKGEENPWREELLRFFKSLKDRYAFKPSDEQLEALKEAVDEHFDIDGGALWHLYEDLKKL